MSAVVCSRCVWERSLSGREAETLLAVALRAHVEVWHPDLAAEPVLPPPRPAIPRPRSGRPRPLPVAVAPGY